VSDGEECLDSPFRYFPSGNSLLGPLGKKPSRTQIRCGRGTNNIPPLPGGLPQRPGHSQSLYGLWIRGWYQFKAAEVTEGVGNIGKIRNTLHPEDGGSMDLWTLHGVTTQKTSNWNITAVKASKLTSRNTRAYTSLNIKHTWWTILQYILEKLFVSMLIRPTLWHLTFGLHKMRGISWLAEWLSASQEGLYSLSQSFSNEPWGYITAESCDLLNNHGAEPG
jgi:hypothetical protein